MDIKKSHFKKIEEFLKWSDFKVRTFDDNRPWGGFFALEDSEAERFAALFFPDEKLDFSLQMSPKILIVAPQQRLSWQYHYRRSEIWKVLGDSVAVMKSDTDQPTEAVTYQAGEIIRLKQGERHRLIGLEEWGYVAEIWKHSDANNPSDENDIVRVSDDFGR